MNFGNIIERISSLVESIRVQIILKCILSISPVSKSVNFFILISEILTHVLICINSV